jgi:hypothetical protein
MPSATRRVRFPRISITPGTARCPGQRQAGGRPAARLRCCWPPGTARARVHDPDLCGTYGARACPGYAGSGRYPSDLTDAHWRLIAAHLPEYVPGRTCICMPPVLAAFASRLRIRGQAALDRPGSRGVASLGACASAAGQG